jgi:Dolichyl-phosphate-mannose-protein mannosyltransferase
VIYDPQMRILLGLLPLVSLLLLVGIIARTRGGLANAVAPAAVGWGLFLTAMTEILGIAHLIWSSILTLVWGTATVILALMWYRGRPHHRRVLGFPSDWGRLERATVLGVALAVGVILVVAILGPPNTHDALTYHMSRVAHWAQNGSVAHYPTSTQRQLYQPPFAEFVILQSFVLSGDDRLSNLVQSLAMVGSLVLVAGITRKLGGSVPAQVSAVAIAATIPMGILQASGTKNDWVLAFWLLSGAEAVLAACRTGPRQSPILLAGAAFGLALLTKGTAYLFVVPWAVWLAADTLYRHGRAAVRPLLLGGAVTLLVSGAYYARNVGLYGTPLVSEDAGFRYANDTFGPSILVSGVIRNSALHAGTSSGDLNRALEAWIWRAHRWLGIDPDDPRTTWRNTTFRLEFRPRHEDSAGNGLHALLALVTLAALLITVRQTPIHISFYAACVVLGFLLFSAYFRWQPWHARLHLPLFVLGAPLSALLLASRHWLTGVVAAVLLLAALPQLLANETRPLVGKRTILGNRTAFYYVAEPDLGEAVQEAIRVIRGRGCHDVGILPEGYWGEYLLWALARQSGKEPLRIEHVNVPNASKRAPTRPNFQPCALVTGARARRAAVGNTLYTSILESDRLTVFIPTPFTEIKDLARLTGSAKLESRLLVRVLVSAARVRSGDRFTMGLEGRSPEDRALRDLCLGVVLPDRMQVVFVVGPGRLLPARIVQDRGDLVTFSESAPAGSWERPAILDLQISPEIPAGTYEIFAMVLRHATHEVEAVDTISVTVGR